MHSVHIFHRIVFLCGKPDIDLFASGLHTQVETYVSWRTQPIAKFVDALSIEWSQIFFCAFPPFCLISRCVQTIIHDQASGILIVPRKATQSFFFSSAHLVDRHTLCSEGFRSESDSSNFGQSPSTSSTTGVASMQTIRQSLPNSEI